MTDEHDEKARELTHIAAQYFDGLDDDEFMLCFAKDVATALRAAACAREWQPIETAPKTSKAILVYVPSNRCTFTVTWRDGDRAGPSGWQVFGGGFRAFLSDPEGPSHWQPLPSPPATEQQREG